MTVRARTGQRRLPGMNQGPSGRHPRRRRTGSGPTRRARPQGRSGGPGRAPPRRQSHRPRPPCRRSHRRRAHRRRSHRSRSQRRRSHRRPRCASGARRLCPHPPGLRDLSIVPSSRRFRPIRGVGGMRRGAGRVVRLGLPTHRGTDPRRGTSLPARAPGSRPAGRRETMAERLHHERVKVPLRGPAAPSTRNPETTRACGRVSFRRCDPPRSQGARPGPRKDLRPVKLRRCGGRARSIPYGPARTRSGDPSCRRWGPRRGSSMLRWSGQGSGPTAGPRRMRGAGRATSRRPTPGPDPT